MIPSTFASGQIKGKRTLESNIMVNYTTEAGVWAGLLISFEDFSNYKQKTLMFINESSKKVACVKRAVESVPILEPEWQKNATLEQVGDIFRSDSSQDFLKYLKFSVYTQFSSSSFKGVVVVSNSQEPFPS